MCHLSYCFFAGYISSYMLCGSFGFPVATEEALVKDSDSKEALAADKKGVNSSVSESLQEARLTGHQRLEVYKTRRVDIIEPCSTRH